VRVCTYIIHIYIYTRDGKNNRPKSHIIILYDNTICILICIIIYYTIYDLYFIILLYYTLIETETCDRDVNKLGVHVNHNIIILSRHILFHNNKKKFQIQTKNRSIQVCRVFEKIETFVCFKKL